MDHEESTFTGHNGLKIKASTTGPKTGFPVMLAHGGGQTRHAWAKVLDELANAGYRATAIDMRGHGTVNGHQMAPTICAILLAI